MKYIKHYEELKSTTYKKVADRLKRKHPERSKRLNDWSKEVENEEDIVKGLKEYDDSVSKYSKFGKFTFLMNNEPMEFYLCIAFYRDYFTDGDLEPGTTTSLIFEFLFIPVDLEEFKKIQSLDTEESYKNKFYRPGGKIILSFNITDDFFKMDNIPELRLTTDDNYEADIKLSDRSSALRLKRLIRSFFTSREYPSFYDSKYPSMYSDIDSALSETGLSSEHGLTMDDFIKMIDNLSINQMYN